MAHIKFSRIFFVRTVIVVYCLWRAKPAVAGLQVNLTKILNGKLIHTATLLEFDECESVEGGAGEGFLKTMAKPCVNVNIWFSNRHCLSTRTHSALYTKLKRPYYIEWSNEQCIIYKWVVGVCYRYGSSNNNKWISVVIGNMNFAIICILLLLNFCCSMSLCVFVWLKINTIEKIIISNFGANLVEPNSCCWHLWE